MLTPVQLSKLRSKSTEHCIRAKLRIAMFKFDLESMCEDIYLKLYWNVIITQILRLLNVHMCLNIYNLRVRLLNVHM